MQGKGKNNDDTVTTVRNISWEIPNEVWERILYMRLYDGTEFSAHLQWADITANTDVTKERRLFKREMHAVSHRMNTISTRVLWRMLVITSEKEIYTVRSDTTTKSLGECTKRLDVAIDGSYTPSTLGRLLRLLPRLEVFVLRNRYEGVDPPIRFPPRHIINYLGQWNPGLTQIQFESKNEEPTVRMIKQLLREQKKLRTLHLDSVYWPAQGDDDNGKPIRSPHESLTTLSLGSVQRRYHTRDGLDRAGVFLEACIKHNVLPNMTRLHLQKSIPTMRAFLEKYGGQLEELAFGGGDHQFGPVRDGGQGSMLSQHILTYTPNINELIVIASDNPSEARFQQLPMQTSAEDVYVVQVHIEGEDETLVNNRAQARRLIGQEGFDALKRLWLVNVGEADDEEEGNLEEYSIKGVVVRHISNTQ